jgi:hypothetical protein
MLSRQVAASAIIARGPNVLDLAQLLDTSIVMAADPVEDGMRLLVANEALREFQGFLVTRGYTSKSVELTLEDAALFVARRPPPTAALQVQ